MGYTMKGSPAKLGTIKGTAGHASALKMKAEADAASALKDLGHGGHAGMTKSQAAAATHGGKMDEERVQMRKDANTPQGWTEDPKMSKEDWKKGQEKAKTGGDDLDALVARRKGLKKGSDEYNVVQNKINKALGDKTRHGQATEATDTKGRKTKEVTTTPGEGTDTKVTTGDPDDPKKVVTKTRDAEGKVIKKVKVKGDVTKTTTKTEVDEKGRPIVVKTKEEEGKAPKVKVRRKGGTGLGAKIKGLFSGKKKKKKEEEEVTE